MYKRQEYEHITKKPLLHKVEHGIDAAIECGIRVKINVVLTPQTAVSYTHLDVYKRQVY